MICTVEKSLVDVFKQSGTPLVIEDHKNCHWQKLLLLSSEAGNLLLDRRGFDDDSRLMGFPYVSNMKQ
ncbi:MAG: hypothetical protein IPL92_18065 [Saprospiraceae bacterium]|nr:hypothetical protein [Candidatus Opimibacter iunctus]